MIYCDQDHRLSPFRKMNGSRWRSNSQALVIKLGNVNSFKAKEVESEFVMNAKNYC